MKLFNTTLRPISSVLFFALFFTSTLNFSQELEFNKQDANLIMDNPDLVFWHVKAIKPDARVLHIKLVDQEGKFHPVKAIQDSDQTMLMDVKAFIDGKRIPVKLIVREGHRYYPLKAITGDGTIMDIKAITDKGEKYDVKGVSKTGNIVHIRAISPEMEFFNVVAISPEGRINDVKGIKMMKEEVETVINGVKIFAHVKSMSPDRQATQKSLINK